MSDDLISVDDDFWNHPDLLQYASISNTGDSNHSHAPNKRKRKFIQIRDATNSHMDTKRQRTFNYNPSNTQNNSNNINNYHHSNSSNTNPQFNNPNRFAHNTANMPSNHYNPPNTNNSTTHHQPHHHNYQPPREIAPECNHKLPMIKRTTRKPGKNYGRSFWCCDQSQQNQCKRFLWDQQWQRDLKQIKKQKTKNGQNAYALLMSQKLTVSTELICIQPIALVEVSIHPPEPPFTECIKQLPNAQWHADKRKWVLPLDEHSKLIHTLRTKCKAQHYTFTMDVIPNEIIKNALKWTRINPEDEEEAKDCVLKLPLKLRSCMYSFQKEGVKFAVSKGGRCLIADEMGLGKSIQAIAIAYYYHEDWPLLIVVPSSLTLTWKCEILKWLKGILYEDDIKIIKKGSDMMVRYDDKLGCSVPVCPVTIISYGLAVRKHAEFMDSQRLFGMIICDESHALKNHKTKRCKVLIPLIKSSTRRAILLSGTPTNNRPSELWTQIDALRPNEFMSFRNYGIRYCEGQYSKFGWVATGAMHLKELHAIIKHRVMIRRCKKEVLTELPDKLRTVINIECDKGLEKKIKKKMEKDLCLKDQIEFINSNDNTIESVGEEDKNDIWDKKNKNMLLLYALTGKSKIGKIKEYVYDLFESGEKFLVFAHHLEVLDAVQECVEHKCKTQFIRIDGGTKPDMRQVLVSRFQNNDNIRIAVLSITAAGTGLTLTAATSVVFAELYWGPTALLQCEDRAHRISQKNIVNIVYLLGKGSLDDRMWPMISKKMEVISRTLSGKQLKMEIESYKEQYIERASPKKSDNSNHPKKQNECKQPRITSMLTFTPVHHKSK